jgi:hypothetical protein
VLANHGFVFDKEEDRDDPNDPPSSIQQYFDERYWYERKPQWDARELSPIERQNIDTITLAMTRQQGRTLSPGMMHLFRANPLTDRLLAGVAIADLRLLRNEVYARHGSDLFRLLARGLLPQLSWYQPRADYSGRRAIAGGAGKRRSHHEPREAASRGARNAHAAGRRRQGPASRRRAPAAQ